MTPLYVLVAAALLVVFVSGVGLVERSTYVVVPGFYGAACIDGDVTYIVTKGSDNSVVYAWSLNGTLLGRVWVYGLGVECLATEGRLYVLTYRDIYLFDRDLRQLGAAELKGVVFNRSPFAGSPHMVLRGDRLYIASGGDELFVEVRDANTLRLLDIYKLPKGRCPEWRFARGDGVVAYGVCPDGLVIFDVERTSNKTLPLDYAPTCHADLGGVTCSGGYPQLLSLGGRLYLASGSTLTWLDKNVSWAFPGRIYYLDTDRRYIYVAYDALARLTPELDLGAEVAVGHFLDAAIRDDVLYLIRLSRSLELPGYATEIGIDVIRLGDYSPGNALFCYLPTLAERIWLSISGVAASDCCCIYVRGLMPGWHTFYVVSSGDLTKQILIRGGMLKWESILPKEVKQSYVVYVEPGRTVYLVDVDTAFIYLLASFGLFMYFLFKLATIRPYDG